MPETSKKTVRYEIRVCQQDGHFETKDVKHVLPPGTSVEEEAALEEAQYEFGDRLYPPDSQIIKVTEERIV